ncbi:hypothetical protein PTKIN_Ptkin10aG0033900 [Pterospermum kingtungense]
MSEMDHIVVFQWGCFGICTENKRRKPANRILSGDLKLVNYEPLVSSVCTNLDIPENPITSNSQLSKKAKERSSIKIRKKRDSKSLQVGSYPPNYKYQNCRESYDEEDEMAYAESDLEDDDYFYDYDDKDESEEADKDVEDQRQRREELLDQFESLNMVII